MSRQIAVNMDWNGIASTNRFYWYSCFSARSRRKGKTESGRSPVMSENIPGVFLQLPYSLPPTADSCAASSFGA